MKKLRFFVVKIKICPFSGSFYVNIAQLPSLWWILEPAIVSDIRTGNLKNQSEMDALSHCFRSFLGVDKWFESKSG